MIIYKQPLVATAVTAQVDLSELVFPAAYSARLVGFVLNNLTEVGDAQEEDLSILANTGSTTSGSGGNTAVVCPPINTAAKAFIADLSGASETFNTTKATGGTIITPERFGWNVRGTPFIYFPPPEARMRIPPGERFTLELATTPADSITISGYLLFSLE